MPEQEDAAVSAGAFAPVAAQNHVGSIAPAARRFAWRVAVAIVVVLALPASVWLGSARTPAAELQPCATEYSVTNCYWDAGERGNGSGRSFEARDGVIRYTDGETVAIPDDELDGVGR